MNGSKLKNIIIVILLLVNVAFLTLIVEKKVDIDKREKRVRESLVSVMAENGITLDKDAIPSSVSLTEYRIGRDVQAELTAAQAVLGDCEREDQGGNIYSYASDSGVARFRGNGEFEIRVNAENAPEYSESAAVKLMKSMGIEAYKSDSTEENGTRTISFQCTIDGKSIFGCSAELVYENGKLVSVTGRRPTSEPEYRTAGSFITVPTAMMSFIEALSSGGHVCSSIDAIKSGYMFFTSVSGERTLTPVWRIETDSGSYYINGISGIMVTS